MRALKENEKDLGCSTTHKQQGLLDVIGVIGEITEMKRGHMKQVALSDEPDDAHLGAACVTTEIREIRAKCKEQRRKYR